MIDDNLKRENEIARKMLEYLKIVEKENSILKSNLLKKEEKDFILNNSNAFVIGLISDQSVKAEIAWGLPYKLAKRMGSFDFEYILNNFSEQDIEELIRTKPALHRYPSRIANYIFNAIKEIVYNYDSDAKNIWTNKTASEIVNSFEKFKGISHKKASLGTLLLVRDMDVNIGDKENIDIAYDIHIRRIFLRMGVVDRDVQDDILLSARRMNPEFPGKLTTSFWALGRDICRPSAPNCEKCPLDKICKKKIEKTKNLK